MANNDIIELLDVLYGMVTEAWSVPLGNDKCIIEREKAIEIINDAKGKGLLNGKGPTGVAATALYVASILMGERKTQKDIAEIAGVTEVTIRNRYKELLEKMENVQI